MIQTVFSGIITLILAKLIMNDLPHSIGLHNLGHTGGNGEMKNIVYLPLETQKAMSNLLIRAKAHWGMMEYGFELFLQGQNLYPGSAKRGYKGQIASSLTTTATGFFHTHPMNYDPPYFSETDTVDIFLRPHRRLLGVGHPEYSVAEVSFIALTKAPSEDLVYSIVDNLPGILDEGVHMHELEEYYVMHRFTLGVQPISIEVLLDWTPPQLPTGWWKPKETIEEYIKRKLPE